MSKPSQIVILAEDTAQLNFVWHWLKTLNFRSDQIRRLTPPAGRGGGVQHVLTRLPKEFEAYRKRNAGAKTALIVVIDADTRTVMERRAQLEHCLPIRRSDDEAIAYLVPKRNLETWLHWLSGRDVNEANNYKVTRQESERLVKLWAKTFVEIMPNGKRLDRKLLDSLEHAVREIERLPL